MIFSSGALFFCTLYMLKLPICPLQLDVAFRSKLFCDFNRFRVSSALVEICSQCDGSGWLYVRGQRWPAEDLAAGFDTTFPVAAASPCALLGCSLLRSLCRGGFDDFLASHLGTAFFCCER